MFETLSFFTLIVVAFLVFLAVAWIVLPIALIGTKPILRELLEETKRTNRLLQSLAEKANSSKL